MGPRQPQRRPSAVGIVRDRHGRPKFDSIKGIPAAMWNMLTVKEQKEIKAHGGYPTHGER